MGVSISAPSFYNMAVPVGTIVMFGAPTPPAGWLVCDGSNYDKAVYPALYAVIQNRFGGGGALFQVPNLSDKFAKGQYIDNVGDTGGSNNLTTGTTGTVNDGHAFNGDTGHNHAQGNIVLDSGNALADSTPLGSYSNATVGATTDGFASVVDAGHAHTAGSIVLDGSDTRPAYVTVNFIIRAV